MGAILADIENQPGTRAGAGLDGREAFRHQQLRLPGRLRQGWSGSLIKVQIDSKTGKETPIWSAADQLTDAGHQDRGDARAVVHQPADRHPRRDRQAAAVPLGQTAPTCRTRSRPASRRAARRWSRTCAAAPRTRAPRPASSAPRAKALGDIVNGSPAYVGAPNCPVQGDLRPGLPGVEGLGVAAGDDLRRRQRRHAARLRRRVGRRILGVRPVGALPQAGSAGVGRRQLPEPPRRAGVPGRRAAEVQAPVLGRRPDHGDRRQHRRQLEDDAGRRPGQGRQVVLRRRRHRPGATSRPRPTPRRR